MRLSLIHTYTYFCALWVYDAGLLAIVHGRLPVIRDVLLPSRWRLKPVKEGGCFYSWRIASNTRHTPHAKMNFPRLWAALMEFLVT